MARQRSFTSYVADRFYNELFAVINDYAEIKADSLNLRLYQVNKIGGIELTDITVKFASVNDLKLNLRLLLMQNSMCERLIIIMILMNSLASGSC